MDNFKNNFSKIIKEIKNENDIITTKMNFVKSKTLKEEKYEPSVFQILNRSLDLLLCVVFIKDKKDQMVLETIFEKYRRMAIDELNRFSMGTRND